MIAARSINGKIAQPVPPPPPPFSARIIAAWALAAGLGPLKRAIKLVLLGDYYPSPNGSRTPCIMQENATTQDLALDSRLKITM
jgi:hypothetical protein